MPLITAKLIINYNFNTQTRRKGVLSQTESIDQCGKNTYIHPELTVTKSPFVLTNQAQNRVDRSETLSKI